LMEVTNTGKCIHGQGRMPHHGFRSSASSKVDTRWS